MGAHRSIEKNVIDSIRIAAFLKLNRTVWNVKLVAAAMKLKPSERYTDLDDNMFSSQQLII